MQMKMDKIRVHRFDKLAVRKLLEAEDDFITELLDSCEVPDAIEGKFQICYFAIEFNSQSREKFQMKQQMINIYWKLKNRMEC